MKTRLLPILALFVLIGQGLAAQELNCNVSIFISLDPIGEAYLTPDMALEGTPGSEFDSIWIDPYLLTCDDIATSPVPVTVFGRVTATGEILSCVSNFIVEDKLIPVAVATADYTVDISDGPITITANEIDAGSYDNCGVTISIDPEVIDCTSDNPQFVTLTVTDPSGNSTQAFTSVSITGEVPSSGSAMVCDLPGNINIINGPYELTLLSILENGPSVCAIDYNISYENKVSGGPAPSDFIFDDQYIGETYVVTIVEWTTNGSCWSEFTIVSSGEPNGFCVNDFDGNAVKDVELDAGFSTDESGCVTFNAADGSEIGAFKMDDPNNGVDAVDALLIRAHVLGQITLNNDQQFASDMNANGDVSTLDLVLLEKMALGEYTPEQVWYFYDSNTEISEGDLPSDLVQTVSIQAGITDYSFTGMKMGDIDLSYNFVPTNDDEKASFSITDIVLNKGETYTVPMYMSESSTLLAADVTIPAETADFEITGVTSNLTDFIFEPSLSIVDGVLNIKWVANDDVILNNSEVINADTPVFNLILTAKEDGILSSTFELLEDKTNKWKRNSLDNTTEYLELNIDGKITLPVFNTDFKSFKIYPNPAQDIIVMESEENLINLTFAIYSLTGNMIQNGRITTSQNIDISQLPIGMYNVLVQQESVVLTQKLTIIR